MNDTDATENNETAALPVGIDGPPEAPPSLAAPKPQDRATARRVIEALLFASAEPLSVDRLYEQVGDDVDVPALLEEIQVDYAPRGVNLVPVENAWRFRTAPDLGPYLKILHQPRRKLPRAAAEVLAIIACHQPVTRGEIESVRGVETSKGTLDLLLEIGWVRPGKRRETPGRPLTWKTTPAFLDHFGLAHIRDLPGLEDLKAAGLLDARPVLATLPAEPDAARDEAAAARDDEDFADWIKDEPEAAA